MNRPSFNVARNYGVVLDVQNYRFSIPRAALNCVFTAFSSSRSSLFFSASDNSNDLVRTRIPRWKVYGISSP